MDVDPSEEEEEDTFGEALLFAESRSFKKKQKYPVTKIRGSYRKYTPEQIERLFGLVIKENCAAKDAALLSEINVCTTQNYVKTCNNDVEKRPPRTYNKPRGKPCRKLTDGHSKFLLEYIKKILLLHLTS